MIRAEIVGTGQASNVVGSMASHTLIFLYLLCMYRRGYFITVDGYEVVRAGVALCAL